MTSVNTNIGSLFARTYSLKAGASQRTSMERLSSGLRINSAADDAAGQTVNTKMHSQLESINVALRNSLDGISLIETASSSITEITDIVQRMRELAVQMHNGVYSDADRSNAQLEITALINEISKLAETTSFNGLQLLDGTYNKNIRAGASNQEVIALLIDGMGILPYIKGETLAAGNSLTVLRPTTSASGPSVLDYLSFSVASGTSVLDILNSSSSAGSSFSQELASTIATGTSNVDILNSVNGSGVSTFQTPGQSVGTGNSRTDYLLSNSGVGNSSFNTPNASSGLGSSSTNYIASANGTGTSTFNQLSSSTALGSSTLDYLASDIGTGSSRFNTPPSVTVGGGSLGFDVLSSTTGTSLTSSDNSSNSTATGLSVRDVLNSETAAGTSQLNYLSNPSASVTSSATSSFSPSSEAIIGPGGASTRYTESYANGNFSASAVSQVGNVASISGWDIYREQISLGPSNGSVKSTILGYATPTDTSAVASDDITPRGAWNNGSTPTSPATYNFNVSNNALELSTNDMDIRGNEGGIIHGPYVVSKESINLNSGDSVSFQWQARGNGDAADVFGYLLNVDDGSTVNLLNQTAPQMGAYPTDGSWVSVSKTLNTSGNYKFVFVSGTWDETAGGKVGSTLAIKNVDVVITAQNAAASNKTFAKVTVQAQESNQVNIGSELLAQLDGIAASDNYQGNYSIVSRGSDYTKFQIDANGNISSRNPLRKATQETYSFDVKYINSSGGSHTETVTLKLTDAQTSTTVLTAQEGAQVSLSAGPSLTSYANADQRNGTFRIVASGNDYSKFQISADGSIRSLQALEFDDQKTFNFDVTYTKTNGESFVDHVTLNITDTLTSTAIITAEETQSLTINAATFTGTQTYAAKDSGTGTYSLSGTDASYFATDQNGRVTSTSPLLYANKNAYSFALKYTHSNGAVHTENVSLTLREAAQGSSSFVANEATTVTIPAASLTKLQNFAAVDNGSGAYSLSSTSGDHAKFNISSNGTITNNQPLSYASQASYVFDAIYTASNGSVYTDTITLELTDPSKPSVAITTEETNALTIPANLLTATAARASSLPGGAYSLLGADAAKFQIDGAGVITTQPGQSLTINKSGTYNFKDLYDFDVLYTVGGTTYNEEIILTVTEALQNSRTVTAHEAGSVSVLSSTEIQQFASRDRNRGTFSIAAASADFDKFTISTSGNVTSKAALDFDTQQSYGFDIEYTASDNRVFTETITLNLTDTLASTATITAEETQSLTIAAATLTSTAAFAAKSGVGGSYQITGTDNAKFSVDANGNVSSTQALLRTNQASYNFNVVYTAAGGAVHTEAVTLNLTEALQGSSTVTAQEANELKIFPEGLSKINDYASRNSGGTFSIVASGGDFNKFQIATNGVISSVNPLDYDVQSSYTFDVKYEKNGTAFTDTVTLNLTDTLASTATITAEETQSLTIAAATLTSTAAFAAKSGVGGSYQITGTDNAKFSVDANGNVSSTQALLRANQASYNFNVVYTAAGGAVHTEAVTLNLTEALQGSSTITSKEASEIIIEANELDSIYNFASRDGFNGQYYIGTSGNDENKFLISDLGRITSRSKLEFDTQQSYAFDVEYRASDNRIFKETVSLNLDDTFTAIATIKAEQSNLVNISANTLSSTAAFAAKSGAGGNYTLGGIDQSFFQIDGNGNISSNRALLIADKSEYKFDVIYTSAANAKHTESVTLELTESLQSTASLTVQESDNVYLTASSMEYLNGFYARDNFAGGWRISTARGDFSYFKIGADGTVASNNALDFSTKNSYSLDVIYRASDSREFTQTVNFNLKDTLSATTTLTAEESRKVTLDGNLFSATQGYISRTSSGGTYSLDTSKADASKFTINATNGNIESIGELRKSDQELYNLAIIYNEPSGTKFTENITLQLTDTTFGRSASTLLVSESQKTNIRLQDLENISAFVNADNAAGTFRLETDIGNSSDYELFELDANGNISSKDAIDYDNGKRTLHFNLFYDAGNGASSYQETITLNIANDLRDDDNLNLIAINVADRTDAADAIGILDTTLTRLTSSQAKLGGVQNRIMHNVESLTRAAAITEISKGRIIDSDFAVETAKLSKYTILKDASTAMLANANMNQNLVLKLLN